MSHAQKGFGNVTAPKAKIAILPQIEDVKNKGPEIVSRKSERIAKRNASEAGPSEEREYPTQHEAAMTRAEKLHRAALEREYKARRTPEQVKKAKEQDKVSAAVRKLEKTTAKAAEAASKQSEATAATKAARSPKKKVEE